MPYDYILWIINCNCPNFASSLYSCSSLTLHPIVRYFLSRHTRCFWIGFFHSHPPYFQQPSKCWIMLTAITTSYMKDFTFIMPKAQLSQKYFSIDSVYELSTVDFVLKSINNISIKDSKVSV